MQVGDYGQVCIPQLTTGSVLMDHPSPFAVCWDVAGRVPFIFKSSCVGYHVAQATLGALFSVVIFQHIKVFTFFVKIMTLIFFLMHQKVFKSTLKVFSFNITNYYKDNTFNSANPPHPTPPHCR